MEFSQIQSTFSPVWNTLKTDARSGFQEAWYVKFNDPIEKKSLLIRFQLSSSKNGFRRVAEVWAIFFSRNEDQEISKVAVKQSYDIQSFSAFEENGSHGIRIGNCELTDKRTRGSVTFKGKSISWDLSIFAAQDSSFNLVPESLTKSGLARMRVGTGCADLRFTGTSSVDGTSYEWSMVSGSLGHLSGSQEGHSWIWAQSNHFVNERNEPEYFIFEGLSARARFAGMLPSPRISTFFFFYRGKEYRLNSFWDAIRSRSSSSFNEWKFHADHGDLSFRGQVHAEHRDFAGLTLEDTDGSLVYLSNSQLANVTIWIYRRGKLETTVKSIGSAAFEIASRLKNPYVPVIL